ncbi:FHA domain-containing protein [Mycetocola lacteus]|uniref:FHA domain-containing protein n=1 Tax=Mycetocola lacteus TaxID=76637 RepID=A0A3L7ARJ2_9MICO|nr:FHA domain-containing protein [Mycetocola lacteus]RLP82022.1 FHA domain-containing protein [Mycetocola lacteus]
MGDFVDPFADAPTWEQLSQRRASQVLPGMAGVVIEPAIEPIEEQPFSDAYGESGAVVEDLDKTIFVRRASPDLWCLVPDGGIPIMLEGDAFVIGRNPLSDQALNHVRIADPGRTVSRTHAFLRRVESSWYITDLDSTNGIVVSASNGTQLLLPSQTEILVNDTFVLGSLCMTLRPFHDVPDHS